MSFATLGRVVAVGAVAAAGTVIIAGALAQADPPTEPPRQQQGQAEPGRSAPPGGGQPDAGAAHGTWIEVSPSTVQAGEQVSIKASCKDRVDEAKAHSKAFGEVMLVPQWDALVGEATVPWGTREGDYEVTLTCVKSGKAETKLRVIAHSRPSHGPHTGGGGLAGSGGDGTVALVGGLGTVAAGAGLAVALRRRRRPA
ncbi:hypothetical protein O7635_00255 [Asanoa sp. WMMD1127]|uniref:hypothetical protein n=1 Tax=Asanoa sp. WMMD1127 TaxID=3016107 RepID=UPI002416F755|nr:hypothetical protein [Asanoa sp. WMMD1127]MDG4820303.1 hypothetical protein [Asanoa sp. WMMD1127]